MFITLHHFQLQCVLSETSIWLTYYIGAMAFWAVNKIVIDEFNILVADVTISLAQNDYCTGSHSAYQIILILHRCNLVVPLSCSLPILLQIIFFQLMKTQSRIGRCAISVGLVGIVIKLANNKRNMEVWHNFQLHTQSKYLTETSWKAWAIQPSKSLVRYLNRTIWFNVSSICILTIGTTQNLSNS